MMKARRTMFAATPLSHFHRGVAAKIVRRAFIMLAVYAAIITLGLIEFRRTPVGFIPQVDQGYLIGIVQLPPGSSISRTDAVMKRAVEDRKSTRLNSSHANISY